MADGNSALARLVTFLMLMLLLDFRRFMNCIISTIEEIDRPAFPKGIMVGVVIRKAVDSFKELDLTDEKKRIALEIEKLGFSL